MQRISLKNAKSLPLLNQSIKTINELLISGQLSAYDLCLKCLERIEKTAQLNAFITITKDISINQSIESNKRFKNGIYFQFNSIIK